MNRQTNRGAAKALPIARSFLDVGGRLMLSPTGQLETGGNFAWFTCEDPREARRSFTACRRFYRRLRAPRFQAAVAALVAQQGDESNGWVVLEAGR